MEREKYIMSKKILIVEDEPAIVESIRYRLETDGYDVISAFDGLSGLNLARSESPDLIVLDVVMPKLDGFNFCRMLKFDQKYEKIPIIMLTGRCGESDMKTVRDVKADVFMTKPFDGDELIAKVQQLLNLPQ